MLLDINETGFNPQSENNKFDFQPYLSRYVDAPLNNFKNNFNSDVEYGSLLVTAIKTPSTGKSTCLRITNTINELPIAVAKGKVNHSPVADFEISVSDGVLTAVNTSYDVDGDELTYNWKISDDIRFRTENVVYEFQNSGAHTISLTVSDEEMSDSKSVSIVSGGADSVVEAVFIDFDISQEGNTFTAVDTSTTRNVYEYDRVWYLDGVRLDSSAGTIEGTVENGRHTIRLECTAGNFRGMIDKNFYYIAEAIISVKMVTIPRGSFITLSSEKSETDGDPITGIEWADDQ